MIQVNKRYLLRFENGPFETNTIRECRVLEFSPSGDWLKLERLDTHENFWVKESIVSIIEELPDKKIKLPAPLPGQRLY